MPYLDNIKIIMLNHPVQEYKYTNSSKLSTQTYNLKKMKLMTIYWPTVPMVLTFFKYNKHYHDISSSVGL